MRLKVRIVLGALAVMTVVIAIVSVLTYELIRVSGREGVDRLLQRESAQLVAEFATAVRERRSPDGTIGESAMIQAARTALALRPSGTQHVAGIALADTRLQSAGGPAEVAVLLRSRSAPRPVPGRLRTVSSFGGPVRMLDVAVNGGSGERIAVITLLAPLDPSRDAAAAAFKRSIVAGGVALVLGAGLLTVVVRRSLRPLEDLTVAAGAITPDALDARVPVAAADDEVRQLATEINDMLQRIEEDDQARRRYLSAISHEIRTPLTVAEGHLELLADGRVELPVAVGTVRQELDRLRRVLDDLLAVARGADEIDIRPGPIFLPDLFQAVQARISALGLSDRVRLEEPPNAAFTGDQARIEQSVSNLIANAIDHNPPRTLVTIAAQVVEDRVLLTVTDDGTGIDPTILPRVCEPFVTTRGTGDRRASGLGLAVVDSLTRAQHGTLAVETGPTGTVVSLGFPVNAPL
jgi:two-component system OmpR family sensor kinase